MTGITKNNNSADKNFKIYFGASITGGRADVNIYSELINHLKKHGEVLTEHIGNKNLSSAGEENKSLVHDRDVNWLLAADVVVAEVSTPSLGVGYELGRAVENHKKILCLYRIGSAKSISGMISGNKDIILKNYNDLTEAKLLIDKFFEELNK